MQNTDCILLLEPDILVRHPLAEYLRACGYLVLEAAEAAEARAMLQSRGDKVHAVLADVDAEASGSGFAFARWLRATHPSVDVILAGSVAVAAEKAGDLCEDGPALIKPYDHRQVLDRIRRLQAQRQRP